MEKNLYEAIKDRKKYLPEKKVKLWMYQILKALDFMHRNGIFHRDIKPENILIRGNSVKLADLGSCKGIYAKHPFTEYISTRWYRSPECLLTDGYYNYKMDIWGLGCVFFEMLTLYPLFPGDDEIDQVNKIHQVLGTPPREVFNKLINHSTRTDIVFEYKRGKGIKHMLSHVSPECIDVISKMLIYDYEERYTAKQCLSHVYFRDLVEQELKLSKMSLVNFRRNPLLMLSLNGGFNESISFARGDESTMKNETISKQKKEEKNILPDIRIYNRRNRRYDENEDTSIEATKRNMVTFLRLPKINKGKKIWKEKGCCNSNDFKVSLKGLNNSIDETHYIKKYGHSIKQRISEVKKNYISPYSKCSVTNNIHIF